jgi:hypothetical protein
MGGINTNIKSETEAKLEFEKPDGLELVITPKKEFLQWFKNTKGILGEIGIKMGENGLDVLECPNCKSIMENHELNNDPNEIWHLCTKCNLSFSQRQHNYFTTMIMRLLEES